MPEANVIMRMRGTHLDPSVFKVRRAVTSDNTRIIIEKFIGLVLFIALIIIAAVAPVIASFGSFDLQNQCSVFEL